MNESKRLFEIGVLKRDHVRLLMATSESERLSAERAVKSCKELSALNKRFAKSLADEEVKCAAASGVDE